MRTRIRTTAAIAALTLTAAACGSDTGADAPEAAACEAGQVDGDLRLYNWSDYMDPGLIADFEAQFGVSVVQDFFTSNEELQARVAAGGANYDVVVPSDYMVALLIEDMLLLPLTHSAIPNLVNVDSEFTQPPYDPGLAFSVPYLWGTTGLGVNTALVGDVEASWDLVFDPAVVSQLPGPIALLDDARETMGAALRWLGYDPNTTDEDELRAASEVISAVRPWTAAFANEGEAPSLLVSGEVVIALGYSGNMLEAFDGDERFEYLVPREGATIWTDNMAILADAPHPCTAHTFIDFVLRPEQHARLTNYIYYPSPNALAVDFIDPDVLEDPAIYPDAETLARLSFLRDTGDSETLFTDVFERARR